MFTYPQRKLARISSNIKEIGERKGCYENELERLKSRCRHLQMKIDKLHCHLNNEKENYVNTQKKFSKILGSNVDKIVEFKREYISFDGWKKSYKIKGLGY